MSPHKSRAVSPGARAQEVQLGGVCSGAFSRSRAPTRGNGHLARSETPKIAKRATSVQSGAVCWPRLCQRQWPTESREDKEGREDDKEDNTEDKEEEEEQHEEEDNHETDEDEE